MKLVLKANKVAERIYLFIIGIDRYHTLLAGQTCLLPL